MGIIDLLKNKRKDALRIKEIEENKTNSMDNIKIEIKNGNGLFDDEPKQIKEAAKVFYQSGKSGTFEDAIINAGTIIRGLKFDGTTKDENGNVVIIFRDINTKTMHKDEYITSPDGTSCQVLDVDKIDFTAAPYGRKSKETLVLKANEGEKVETINGEGKVESVCIANEGNAIFCNNENDKYVPRNDQGIAYKFDDITSYGYEYTSPETKYLGHTAVTVRSTDKARILHEVVDRPTCIKDAWGKGAHQFLLPGATLKKDPKTGKVTGIDKKAFDETWEVLEEEIKHKL